jgi:protein involved in polysaccharide export with SLBB domain
VIVLTPGNYLGGGQLYRRRAFTSLTETNTMMGGKYQINMDLEKVLNSNSHDDFSLQAGDSIYIPYFNPTVMVTGQVVSPGTVLWKEGWDVDDYLNAAGGLSLTGDEDRIVVTYADGSRSAADRVERDPDPSSSIFVAYKEPPEPIKWTEVVSAAATILSLLTALTTLTLLIYNNEKK